MTGLSPEKYDIYSLDNGMTISDFIDQKIKERVLKVSFRHVKNLLHYNVVEPSSLCTFLFCPGK